MANPEADPLPPVLRPNEDAQELIRPALCVQVRDGRLHVSLPYAPILADYLDLVSAVEDTCRYLQMPVWVEGYAPAADPRLRSFSVTPDPGVLEINLPPAQQLGRTRADQHVARSTKRARIDWSLRSTTSAATAMPPEAAATS